MVLFLHNRYRTTGGEERTIEDLMWLVREHLGEGAELLTRDSSQTGRARAAGGLLRGGLGADEVRSAVRLTGATVVHAHNLNPVLGWRALAAAREAGAGVVLHLHNYRLVCAVGTCFTEGADCVRGHGRSTLPGVRHNCRGSLPEAVAYAAALAAWQRRLVAQCSDVIVPSAFAAARLRELGAPLEGVRVHVLAPVMRCFAERTGGVAEGPALVAGRLAPEKGVEVAIEACRTAGVALVVAGDGPERAALQARAAGADVRFAGQLGARALAAERAAASIALVPSLSAETFGLAAAEAMADGVPVAASEIGALPELLEQQALVAPGDAAALAERLVSRRGDPQAGRRGLDAVRVRCAPQVVGPALAAIYAAARGA
jgi:glycosyltransferase involved in cell wall biosynthesis